MEYRAFVLNDYDEVLSLWKSVPGMGLNDVDDSREGIGRFLKRNPGLSFLALDKGRIVGVIMAGHDGRRGHIYHAAVREEYQGQEIGKTLLGLCMDALEREFISKTALLVFERNSDGNAFFERMGFSKRDDLVYRNKNIMSLVRMDT